MQKYTLYKMPYGEAKLKHLIDVLKSDDVADDFVVTVLSKDSDNDAWCEPTGHNYSITTISKPHSYRGDYSQLAFEPTKLCFAHRGDLKEATVKHILPMLEIADGEVFTGYKGGDYVMSGESEIFVAEYSHCGYYVEEIRINKDDNIVQLILGNDLQ